jgi:hypothetical protein
MSAKPSRTYRKRTSRQTPPSMQKQPHRRRDAINRPPYLHSPSARLQPYRCPDALARCCCTTGSVPRIAARVQTIVQNHHYHSATEVSHRVLQLLLFGASSPLTHSSSPWRGL